jgi:hypothetical protein
MPPPFDLNRYGTRGRVATVAVLLVLGLACGYIGLELLGR